MIENINLENFKEGRYTSMSYEMTPKTELQKELRKAKYIENPKERLKKIRSLYPTSKSNVNIERGELTPLKELGFNDYAEYLEYQENAGNMFYNCWVEDAYKRELEIYCYIEDLKASIKSIENNFEKICYLVDQQHKEHTNVLDVPKDDYIYRNEYRALIWDLLQLEINSIVSQSQTSIRELTDREVEKTITTVIKKPFEWKADKNTIGTLFGLLFKKGIITGSKDNLATCLTAMFEGLNKETLIGSLGLKFNNSANAPKYDEETEIMLKDWLDTLIKQKHKPRGSKNTPNKK